MKKSIKKLMMLGLGGVITATMFIGCAKKPPDLNGEWKQVNSNSEDSWQSATIQDGKIIINWVSDNGDSESLYWEGSYVAPTEYNETYTWDSQNQRDESKIALMSSNDDTKTITYEDGQLSYEVGVMGVTTTVRLEKEEQ